MRYIRSYLFLLIISFMALAPGVALLAIAFKSRSLSGFSAVTLSGVTNPAPVPPFDVASFFSGATQSAMEPWLAEHLGRPREIYLRLKNGFDYFLGRSDAGISIGRSWFLNGKSYADEWCLRRDSRATEAVMAPVIAAVIEIAKMMQAKGKPFVFLISPSKAAVFPEYLPSWCDPVDKPRRYDVLLAGLKSADVSVVDGHAIALQVKATQQWPPFGRDGAHWNDIGQFFTARALVGEIERQIGKKLGDLRLKDVTVDRQPLGADADAGLIANLPFQLKPMSYHASFEVADRSTTPTGLFVGTSFSWGPLQIMMSQKLFSPSRFYYYFSSSYRYEPGDLVGRAEGQIAESDLANRLSEADFVVLEANEAELHSEHIIKFATAVRALR